MTEARFTLNLSAAQMARIITSLATREHALRELGIEGQADEIAELSDYVANQSEIHVSWEGR